jgi:hypothetical protein
MTGLQRGQLMCVAAVMALCIGHADAAKWEYVSGDDGVRVYRKQVKGSNVFAFKGVTTKNIHIGKILEIFNTTSLRKDWVDRFHSTKDLKQVGPNERIYWIRFGLPFPISDRDYVLSTKGNFDAEKRSFTARIKSVNHSGRPINDCCERGKAFGTYYKFEALPGPKPRTRMMVEVHTDPKGMLPGWLVNMIQKKWPRKTLNGLFKRSNKKGVGVYASVADWHNPPAPKVPEPAPVP